MNCPFFIFFYLNSWALAPIRRCSYKWMTFLLVHVNVLFVTSCIHVVEAAWIHLLCISNWPVQFGRMLYFVLAISHWCLFQLKLNLTDPVARSIFLFPLSPQFLLIQSYLFTVEGISTVPGTSRYTSGCVIQENQCLPLPCSIQCRISTSYYIMGKVNFFFSVLSPVRVKIPAIFIAVF